MSELLSLVSQSPSADLNHSTGPIWTKNTLPKNPFVGLRPFDIHDSFRFFGRHDQTNELLQRLYDTRFVAALGSSGCGKSSLIRAGLIHDLKAGFLVADCDAWHIIQMKPGGAPLQNLATAMAGGTSALEVNNLMEQIKSSEADLAADIILKYLTSVLRKDTNILILVDQFEEIFRYSTRANDDAAKFVSILLNLTQEEEEEEEEREEGEENENPAHEIKRKRVFVVLTMRSDFIDECDVFSGLPEALNQSLYIVPRLTREQRRLAIEGPIRMYGVKISPSLLELLLNESDSNSDPLPVLQHALMRTWEVWQEDLHNHSGDSKSSELDLDHYRRAGTLAKALDDHADEALKEVDNNLAKRIFQTLTETDSANRQVRRPATFGELQAVTGASDDAIRATIERFSMDGRCFLVWPTPHTADAMIDISHESLIRRWKMLAHWAKEEAESAALYRRLEEATAIHEQDKKHRWHDPQLQSALDWWETRQPNEAWAARVRPSEFFEGESKDNDDAEGRKEKRPPFCKVDDFLRASRVARDATNEQREIERKRAQERKQAEAVARAKAEQEKILADKRKRWMLSLATCLLIAAVSAFWTSLQERQSSTQSKFDALAAQSANLLQADPQRSLLLAATALKLGSEPAWKRLELKRPDLQRAENALRSALAVSGGQGLGGHTRKILTLAVSPDNRQLITGSLDGTVFRWDLTSKQPQLHITKLFESPRSIQAIAIGGNTIATGGKDGIIQISILNHSAPARSLPWDSKIPSSKISALAISRDGVWLAAGREDGSARLWNLQGDLEAGAYSLSLNSPGAISVAQISGDGHWLVLGNNNNGASGVGLWRLENLDKPKFITWIPGVAAVEFSHDGKWLIAGARDGVHTERLDFVQSRPYLAPEPVVKQSAQLPESPVSSVTISPDDKWIVTGHLDGTVRVRDFSLRMRGGPALKDSEEGRIVALKVSPNNRWLVIGNIDGQVRLWRFADFINPNQRATSLLLRGHDGAVEDFAFTSDNSRLLTGGSDGTVRIWNLRAPDPSTRSIRHHGSGDGSSTTAITLSTSGRWLFMAQQTGGGVIHLVDLQTQRRRPFPLQGKRISVATITNDDRWLLTGIYSSYERFEVDLWDLNAKLDNPAAHVENVSAFNLSPDGQRLILCPSDARSVAIWESTTGGWANIASLQVSEPERPIRNVAISPDGQFVATYGADRSIRLRDRRRSSPPRILLSTQDRGAVLALAISPDSRWLVAGFKDGTSRVWEMPSKDLVSSARDLGQPGNSVTSVAFHPEHPWVIIASEGGSARLFDLNATEASEASSPVFDGHRGPIFTIAVSPDGKWLATGGRDGTTRLWSLEGLKVSERLIPEPFVFLSREGPIAAGIFNKNSDFLSTASLDGTVRRWSLRREDMMTEAQNLTGRNLSKKEWELYLGNERCRPTFPDLKDNCRAEPEPVANP